MEGHSAEMCGLETGDVIIKVDDMLVEGMAASDVAGRMSGPSGSSVAVTVTRTTKIPNDNGTVSTTKSTHTAVIVRDVSSDEMIAHRWRLRPRGASTTLSVPSCRPPAIMD